MFSFHFYNLFGIAKEAIEAQCRVHLEIEVPDLTTSTLYQGVQPIYIFGCTSCDKLGTFVDGWGYCPDCFQEMEACVSPAMKELEEQMSGPPPGTRLPKRKADPNGDTKGEVSKKGPPPPPPLNTKVRLKIWETKIIVMGYVLSWFYLYSHPACPNLGTINFARALWNACTAYFI